MSWRAHDDAHSRAVFRAFEERLRPLLADVAPDWLLHTMELRRGVHPGTMEPECTILLRIRPIGSARCVDPEEHLDATPRRLATARSTQRTPHDDTP
jgi:hypothetical protein